MGVFKFKRFEVVNERSAMKVNTDGVLLGALMTILPTDRTLLDIGTGTGTIALMASQRLFSCGICHADRSAENRVDATLVRMADATLREALGGHQGDGAGAGAYIKESAVCGKYGHQGAQKDTVGVHLHGAALIHHLKSLESENSHISTKHLLL